MHKKAGFWIRAILIGCVACATTSGTPAEAAKSKSKKDSEAKSAKKAESKPEKGETSKSGKSDEAMTLEGGQEGTALPSLTIEGEDRIRIEFERPSLEFELDPRSTQGLELGEMAAIIEREPLDLTRPMLGVSKDERTPYLGRAWANELKTGPVAKFRPRLEKVERWKLSIADSRGQTVREFEGKGSPPKELEWDGVTASGAPALPGLTYSYALEAYDRAGNKRNFVGEGFEVSAYRIENGNGLMMLFSGKDVESLASGRSVEVPPPLVLEVVSWINQAGRLDQPIRVQATARSYELANALAHGVAGHLSELVIGDAVRIQPIAQVETDAPSEGTLVVTLAK